MVKPVNKQAYPNGENSTTPSNKDESLREKNLLNSHLKPTKQLKEKCRIP